MSETRAQPDRKPPRLPWAATLFCAACLGAAVWTWMRYSYAWEVTLLELSAERDNYFERYVSVTGTVKLVLSDKGPLVWLGTGSVSVPVDLGTFYYDGGHEIGARRGYQGRFVTTNRLGQFTVPCVDTTASRFHGASVAGLVVGAMGVLVFGLYLRTWVKERRAGQGGREGAQ